MLGSSFADGSFTAEVPKAQSVASSARALDRTASRSGASLGFWWGRKGGRPVVFSGVFVGGQKGNRRRNLGPVLILGVRVLNTPMSFFMVVVGKHFSHFCLLWFSG